MNDLTAKQSQQAQHANRLPREEAVTRSARAGENRTQHQHLAAILERQRTLLACELYDGVTQHLTGAMFVQEEVIRLLESHAYDTAQQRLNHALALVRTAADEARRIVRQRRAGALARGGLVAALGHLATESQQRHGVECAFVDRVDFTSLPVMIETVLLQIAQEALSNALRHGNTRTILISLVQKKNKLLLAVEDWGKGFDYASVGAHAGGLERIRYCARSVGGQANIRSSPGKGTLVKVRLRMPVSDDVRH